MKAIYTFLLLLCLSFAGQAQELQARVTVQASQVSTQVDKKIFTTLQTALTNFINNRKWTGNTYGAQERIKCNFLLVIDQDLGNNVFKATLSIQAARPVYNTAYESPIINYRDQDVQFKYVEFQPVEFNENRVQGSDPLAANITALLAYYTNLIIGMDYDSFSPRGGDPYFQKALYIVNNAPENAQISGWKPFDGLRNRFKLIEGFTDNRYNLLHDAIYSYYRSGFDSFYEDEKAGRNGVLSALSYLNTLNSENQLLVAIPFFFSGKSAELVNVFAKAEPDVKMRARDYLSRLDVSNTNIYKELR
jgi:hypothetical protein